MHASHLIGLMLLGLAGCSGDPSSGTGQTSPTFPASTPLGETCAAAPKGNVSLVSPGVDLSEIAEARFSLSKSRGYVSMSKSLSPATGCGCCQVGGSTVGFSLQPEDMSLGEHSVGPLAEDIQISLKPANADSVEATSGKIVFTGYDPDASALCGTLEATFADYGTISASFSAYDICP